MIDWNSSESHVLLNPKLSSERDRALRAAVQRHGSHLTGHVWIASSGTTGAAKLVALSKEAILSSAAAVNRHLQSDKKDRWLLALPTFHVGGLGIVARAHLSGAKVISLDTWDPKRYVVLCCDEQITLSSLVPTQLYDLVRAELKAPLSLRAVVIGGGRLSPELYHRALELGWPVLPSYGLTECASQVATAPLVAGRGCHSEPKAKNPVKSPGSFAIAQDDSSSLKFLDHVEATVRDGFLCVKGKMLFSGYLIEKQGEFDFMNPMKDGWFVSDDRGEVHGDMLVMHGRAGDIVKIGGENVDVARLDGILQKIMLRKRFEGDVAIVAVPDERLGHVIHLVVDEGGGPSDKGLQLIQQAFNAFVLPYERIREVCCVKSIPRNELGKLVTSKDRE